MMEQTTDAAQVKRIQIRTCANSSREYDAIVLRMADLEFRCDLVHGWRSDRQIRLAALIARESGIELEVTDQRLVTRVQGALAYKSDAEPIPRGGN